MLALRPDAVMLRATWMFDWGHGYLSNLRNTEGDVQTTNQYRGLTWVEEVAQNMRKTILLPGGAYNFGSENSLTMSEVTAQSMQMLGMERTLVCGQSRHDLWIDTSKAQKQGIIFSDTIDGIAGCIQQQRK